MSPPPPLSLHRSAGLLLSRVAGQPLACSSSGREARTTPSRPSRPSVIRPLGAYASSTRPVASPRSSTETLPLDQRPRRRGPPRSRPSPPRHGLSIHINLPHQQAVCIRLGAVLVPCLRLGSVASRRPRPHGPLVALITNTSTEHTFRSCPCPSNAGSEPCHTLRLNRRRSSKAETRSPRLLLLCLRRASRRSWLLFVEWRQHLYIPVAPPSREACDDRRSRVDIYPCKHRQYIYLDLLAAARRSVRLPHFPPERPALLAVLHRSEPRQPTWPLVSPR